MCELPIEIGKIPYRPIVNIMRDPAFMQDSARAKKLIIAPMEIMTPIHFTPRFSLRVDERGVKLIERRIVVGQGVRLDVGDEDKKCAGQQQAGDDGAGNGHRAASWLPHRTRWHIQIRPG